MVARRCTRHSREYGTVGGASAGTGPVDAPLAAEAAADEGAVGADINQVKKSGLDGT